MELLHLRITLSDILEDGRAEAIIGLAGQLDRFTTILIVALTFVVLARVGAAARKGHRSEQVLGDGRAPGMHLGCTLLNLILLAPLMLRYEVSICVLSEIYILDLLH